MKKVRAAGYEVGGQRYKRVPRRYDADHPRRELLLHAGLYAWTEQPVPREAHTATCPRVCASVYRKLKPIQDWTEELVRG